MFVGSSISLANNRTINVHCALCIFFFFSMQKKRTAQRISASVLIRRFDRSIRSFSVVVDNVLFCYRKNDGFLRVFFFYFSGRFAFNTITFLPAVMTVIHYAPDLRTAFVCTIFHTSSRDPRPTGYYRPIETDFIAEYRRHRENRFDRGPIPYDRRPFCQ